MEGQKRKLLGERNRNQKREKENDFEGMKKAFQGG